MELKLLKTLLKADFYHENKANLSKSLFDDEVLELYEVLSDAHDKYGTDLTLEELEQLWKDKNPVATNATLRSMHGVIESINDEEPVNPTIMKDLLHNLWTRDLGRRVADLGLKMAQGKEGQFEKIRQIIEQSSTGVLPTDFGEDTTLDIDKLLEFGSDNNRFRFNINSLSNVCYGIGRGEFGIIFARPETGKTAFSISLPFAPGGYADQGLRVAYLGNEEATERTALRAISSWTGMTKKEIEVAPKLAAERFEFIKDNIFIKNIFGWDITKVEGYLEKIEPDVVIVDQSGKVGIDGNFNAEHERLRGLYTSLREIPKRLNLAMWGVSQASAAAEGKTQLDLSMFEQSKTGIASEVDIAIGIGKYGTTSDSDNDDPIRFLNLAKNKISGWHGTVTCKLESKISRYVD